MKTDTRLPYTEIDDGFLPPRDPVLGLVKIGGKDPTIRYARGTGRPWVAPTRFLDPARFEIVSREKRTQTVKGAKGSSSAGQDFTVDLGYVRDQDFHDLEGVGPKPSSLRVRLLYPRWNQNLIAFLGAYGSGAWACRGNGVEATDIQRGECACPCPRLVQFTGKYEGKPPNDGKKLLVCKPHGQLNVLLEDAGVFGGFWAFKTTSYETISNLTKSLQIFEEMFGRVDGLPLELRVMAATKQIPGGGTTTQPIVTLVLAASMDTARQVAADAAAESRKFLPAGGPLDETKYLAAVVSEMEAEAESYAGEFLPVEVIEEPEDSGDVRGSPENPGNIPDPTGKEPDDEERGDGPEGSGGRHPSPPDDPNQEAGDEGDDDTASDEHKGTGGQPSDGEPAGPGLRETRGPSTSRHNESPDGEGRAVEGGGRDRADAPEAVDDSDRNDPEQLARDVLEATGIWEKEAIDARIAWHLQEKTVDKLLERLERGHPDAWARVTQSEIFEENADEPADGLPS